MNFTDYLTTKEVSPPLSNEVEISLFGAGVGECAVIHIGNGSWIIIDSCLETETRNPISLEYLKYLNVDLKKDVKMIVATHWHDDHVKGLHQVVRQCENAAIVTSQAFTSAEFIQLLEIQKNHKRVLFGLDTGVDEFNGVLSLVGEEYEKKKKRFVWASSRKMLRQYTSPACSVYSLSPADAEHSKFIKFLQEIGAQKLPAAKKTVVSNRKNNVAVVLWLKFEKMNILMGSDLEETSDKSCGWSAIIDSWMFKDEKATFYKVAHHGSKTGHHQDVWEKLLEPNPYAMLTPFSRSRLPKDADLSRIKSLTDKGFVTSGVNSKRPPKRDRAVEKMLSEIAISHKLLGNNMGMIQWRFNVDTGIKNIKLYGSAQGL